MGRRALLSVSDKTGLADFARGLSELGFELVSTGGTSRALEAAGLAVTPVERLTNTPEMMGGRVKTLHPAVHGAILFRREDPGDREAARQHGIGAIDLVAVNLYPFVEAARSRKPLPALLEQMDIGGPALLRAAAKNHKDVLVVARPARYGEVLSALRSGAADARLRLALAVEAIRHTACYDAAIARVLSGIAPAADPFPEELPLAFERAGTLRYGENPHQRGALYRDPLAAPESLAWAEVLSGGKGLSYTNWLDLAAAQATAAGLSTCGPVACAIVKHAIPCGAAAAKSPAEAFRKAWAGDPVSAYGSVVAFSGPLDREVLDELGRKDRYVEGAIAPGYDSPALEELLARRKNLRVLRSRVSGDAVSLRCIPGGALLQEPDAVRWDPSAFRVVTKATVPEASWGDLEFAWRLVAHVRSNAVVIVKGAAAVGVGSGQTNRVDAVRIAAERATWRAKGAVLASDAFFPFADGIEEAIRAGVSCIVQPGGSVRDAECVAACDAAGIPMLFTGMRHFSH